MPATVSRVMGSPNSSHAITAVQGGTRYSRLVTAVAVPRWQSPLAIGLYLFAFALLAMAWSRSRSRGLAQRAESLAREVDERTRALGELNRQLEQASLTDPLTGQARQFESRLQLVAAQGHWPDRRAPIRIRPRGSIRSATPPATD